MGKEVSNGYKWDPEDWIILIVIVWVLAMITLGIIKWMGII